MADDNEKGAFEAAGLIVQNYVANNNVSQADLPGLIRTIHETLKNLDEAQAQSAERGPPAIPVKKSITPDYLVSLEDGRKYKTLKRHLSGLGLTPAQYRAKWDLPSDYPMVSPNYSSARSAMAKSTGLGTKGRGEAAPAPAPAPTAPKAEAAPKKRGRPPKAIDPATDQFT